MASTTTETSQPEKSPISESENIITRKIGEIILDPKINTREVDSEILGEYKDVINSYHREVVQGNGTSWQDHWNELPRITKSNHLWSGFHTVTAAREVFSVGGEIRCIVEGENYRDAYFLATRTNAQHGRRRTNAEKQTSVDRWLNDEETNLWTDSYIAKQCHVTHVFVGKRRLATISSQPTKRKFINAKGDIEWMHTTRIGKTQPPPSPPPASDAKQRKTEFQAYVKHRNAAVLTDEEAKAQADASGATDMMLAGYIDDCKTSVENLLATEQVPLVLKYAAEAFLKTIGKYLLHEKEEA